MIPGSIFGVKADVMTLLECLFMANKRSLSYSAGTSAYHSGTDIQNCDVRFVTEFVCSTPRSRPYSRVLQTAGFDPKRKLVMAIIPFRKPASRAVVTAQYLISRDYKNIRGSAYAGIFEQRPQLRDRNAQIGTAVFR